MADSSSSVSGIKVLPLCRGFRKAARHFGEHFHGQILFRYLKWRFRRELRELIPLALFLERDLFQELRDSRVELLRVDVLPNELRLFYEHLRQGDPQDVVPSAQLAETLIRLGIRRVQLDTRLEFGQIVEAFLLFAYAHPALGGCPAISDEYSGWRRWRVAAALLSDGGYKKFCALLRYLPDDEIFVVRYAYCPLFFSRAVQNYARLFGQFGDHRALFQLAPRAGLLLLLLFLAPAALIAWHPFISVITTLLLGCVAATLLALGIQTIGSIQYDQEHYEEIREAQIRRVRHLSRFPETNPNPILQLDQDAVIIYSNPAAKIQAEALTGTEAGLQAILPDKVQELIRACLVSSGEPCQLEHTVGNSTLSLRFSPYSV